MWLFKRKTKTSVDYPAQDSMRTKIERGIIKLQRAVADRMNTAVAKLSVRKLKIMLLLFCLVSGGISIYLATNGLFGSSTKNKVIKIEQTLVPKHFDKSGDEIKDVQNIIDEDLYSQVKTFRSYVDSLQMNDKAVYDSILLSRPRLMDSIKMMEELYLSQQIK